MLEPLVFNLYHCNLACLSGTRRSKDFYLDKMMKPYAYVLASSPEKTREFFA